MASLERRSQSAILMSNPTTNPPKLDILQDPTLQNQSKTCLYRWKNIDSCIIGNIIRFITFKPYFLFATNDDEIDDLE
jgi:hypothetical protein